MTDKDLSDNRKSAGGSARGGNESHHGWKSKWVESTAPSADDPIDEEEMKGHNDVRVAGPRVNPPELDQVPGDGGEETTDT